MSEVHTWTVPWKCHCFVGFVGVRSRRWALKRESYENRSAVSIHVGQSDHRGQLNVSVNVQQPSGPEHRCHWSMAALFYSPVDFTDASDMHHSNASLMHRWINRWIKQRSLCRTSATSAVENRQRNLSGPLSWNALPSQLCDLAISINILRQSLKTYRQYSDWLHFILHLHLLCFLRFRHRTCFHHSFCLASVF